MVLPRRSVVTSTHLPVESKVLPIYFWPLERKAPTGSPAWDKPDPTELPISPILTPGSISAKN